VGVGAAMLQTRRWRARLNHGFPGMAERVVGAFDSPLLTRAGGGWVEA